ncbi:MULTISPECIES: integron [unclassified Methylobacterium]|uniref:integron n=1 Tax=unclassified Methylobacterium TaxID=2615210 RepID=UPI0022699312|nr:MULTISPECIES: integron [unclassified Methylobacterium]
MSTQQHGTFMPSIASRLGPLFVLMLPSMALAETAPLNVPILLRGSIGNDACPEKGRVFEVGSEPEGFLPVQSGPGEAPFREIGRLHEGDVLVICEKLGPWLGVVYGVDLLGCRTTILVPVEQTYTGPCDHGSVMARNVNIDTK